MLLSGAPAVRANLPAALAAAAAAPVVVLSAVSAVGVLVLLLLLGVYADDDTWLAAVDAGPADTHAHIHTHSQLSQGRLGLSSAHICSVSFKLVWVVGT